MKRIVLLFAGLCALCAWSCKETAQEITLSETQVALYVGEQVALEANAAVDWMSDDSFYASVNAEGEVLARHVGTTTIVARGADGGRATCTVTVKPYFNTFTEPCLEAFGQSASVLKAMEERELISETEEQSVSRMVYQNQEPYLSDMTYTATQQNGVIMATFTVEAESYDEVIAAIKERHEERWQPSRDLWEFYTRDGKILIRCQLVDPELETLGIVYSLIY